MKIYPTDEEDMVEILGRHLKDSELGTYSSLEELPKAVKAVVAKLASRYRILACKYLHARVPSVDLGEVMVCVQRIMESSHAEPDQ